MLVASSHSHRTDGPRRAVAPVRRARAWLALALLAPGATADAATVSAKLRWQPSASAAGYRVYWRALPATTSVSLDAGLPAAAADGALSYLVPGIDATTATGFRVSAYQPGGVESAPSNEIVLPAAATAGGCASPTVVPAAGGTFTGATSGSDALAGSCVGVAGSPERVFAWTPAVSGTATIQTCSATQTTFDTVLYLRQGSCAAGTEVACNDDTQGCGNTLDPSNPYHGSRITPTVTAGQTYYVVVDGYAGAAGNFALTIVPPSGCANTTVVPAGGGVFTGATSGASALSAGCAPSSAAPERVFQWTPAISGTATIHTCSATQTTFDTVLYLRQGACGGGADLVCNDDTTGCGNTLDTSNPHQGSRLTPTVAAGQTYFIVVDGYASAAGTFQLTVTPPPGTAASALAPAPPAALAPTSADVACRSVADCPPADACTEVRCVGGRCTGAPLACDGTRPCEEATCASASGCVVRPAADGASCSGDDPCAGGACRGGACESSATALPGRRLGVRRFTLRADRLVATGEFDAAGAVDPTLTGVTLEVSAPDGRLLYRATVAAARFVASRTRRAFRYVAPHRAPAPAEANGLTRLVVQRGRSRVHVAAVVTSAALAAAGREPTVRWMLRLGDLCARELALDCTAEPGSAVRCASASGVY